MESREPVGWDLHPSQDMRNLDPEGELDAGWLMIASHRPCGRPPLLAPHVRLPGKASG